MATMDSLELNNYHSQSVYFYFIAFNIIERMKFAIFIFVAYHPIKEWDILYHDKVENGAQFSCSSLCEPLTLSNLMKRTGPNSLDTPNTLTLNHY